VLYIFREVTVKLRHLFFALVFWSVVVPAGQAQTTSPESRSGEGKSTWSVRCIADSREAPPDCTIEQRAIVTQTGRLLMQVTIRVPADTRKPVLMVQGPLGTFLPAGLLLDVDGSDFQKLDFQTCEASGCYAASPLTPEQLKTLFNGQSLNINVQSTNKQPIKVPMTLIGFTSAYRKIQ